MPLQIIVLTCKVKLNSKQTLQRETNSKTKHFSFPFYYRLIIVSVDPQTDYGNYTCIAVNIAGNDSGIIELSGMLDFISAFFPYPAPFCLFVCLFLFLYISWIFSTPASTAQNIGCPSIVTPTKKTKQKTNLIFSKYLTFLNEIQVLDSGKYLF